MQETSLVLEGEPELGSEGEKQGSLWVVTSPGATVSQSKRPSRHPGRLKRR